MVVECAAKGSGTPCTNDGPPTRRCGLCGAVAYCSLSHQLSHWNDHKEECGRFEQQMRRADMLADFPFTFSVEITDMEARCSFLKSRGLHLNGIWKSECCCMQSIANSDDSRVEDDWNLPTSLCPCIDPRNPLSTCLRNWMVYYQWRCLPFHSPVALLLHWPLTIYHCFQISSTQTLNVPDKLIIHYLGPDKELLQLAAFRELGALFPGVHVHIEFFGPAVPQFRDGKRIGLHSYSHCSEEVCACKSSENASAVVSSDMPSAVTLQFHKGFYHDCCRDNDEVSCPDIIVAPNAGIAAYSSWLPTIELIKEMGVPAIFTDFCEEAANLAANCIQALTGRPLRLPVQINPFRQPMHVENSAMYLPCYSNCFLFGM